MEGFFILEVGRRIKEKRLDKRMTLQELGDKSGVSKGLVSQIENGRTIPSLPVMLAIIQSLEIEVSAFFQGLSLLEPTILVNRKAEYTPFEKEDARGFSYKRMMMRNLPASTIDFAILELSIDSYREEVTTDAYEFIYVMKGTTEYRVNSQTLVLEEGDSIFFDGRLPHVPKNISSTACTLLVLYFFDQNS
jgi:transcriptional regulator with XRE-family HTH domain